MCHVVVIASYGNGGWRDRTCTICAKAEGYRTAEYAYDGLNRRVAKVVADGEDIWDRTDYYYNEAWQVLEERQARDVDDQERFDPATDVYCQYVWDLRYIDAPVVAMRDLNLDDDVDDLYETVYYCTDANMNVTALLYAGGCNTFERYVYDPYGRPKGFGLLLYQAWPAYASAIAAWGNEILYAGYRWDPETGFYHVRNRMYAPHLGRWLQRDPAGYGDGRNLYQYGASSPTLRVDPSGLAPNPTWENASGCGGANAPDPVYDQRMMNEMWNRAMYHYDCQRGLNGRKHCPDIPGGHEQAYEYWLKQYEHYRDQYNRNKGGGRGTWLCDYYTHRVTCEECALDKEVAQARCEMAIRGQTFGYVGTIAAGAAQTGLGVAAGAVGSGILKYAPGYCKLIAIPFYAVGFYELYQVGQTIERATDARNRSQEAIAKYCNCDQLVP